MKIYNCRSFSAVLYLFFILNLPSFSANLRLHEDGRELYYLTVDYDREKDILAYTDRFYNLKSNKNMYSSEEYSIDPLIMSDTTMVGFDPDSQVSYWNRPSAATAMPYYSGDYSYGFFKHVIGSKKAFEYIELYNDIGVNIETPIGSVGISSIYPGEGGIAYISKAAGVDIYTFENPNLSPCGDRRCNYEGTLQHLYRIDLEDNIRTRLTYSYNNIEPIVSNDGYFLIYSRELFDNSEGKNGVGKLTESVICRSDGGYKSELFVGLNDDYEYGSLNEYNWYLIKNVKNDYLRFVLYGFIKPSFDIIGRDKQKGELGYYYYSTPYYHKTEKPGDGNSWTVFRISIPNIDFGRDYRFLEEEHYVNIEYDYNVTEIELGIPFSEFDYTLDIRFRSDGKYASIVGIKDGITAVYIFDVASKELTKVNDSEGAITARWVEVID